MAFRIHENVVRGEIDNTRRGTVTGKIWLAGREKPLVLTLEGNCWRDLAGCRCAFTNPNPKQEPEWGMAEDQTGVVGDMTASRKVRVPDLPLREWCERRRAGLDAPEHWANCLYLEWYSERNGRVVVESVDYDVQVSMPEWEMTEEEEELQLALNYDAMMKFMNRLATALEAEEEEEAEEERMEVPEDRPMDEHEWERFLRECDKRTERYGELLDKYQDHPDRDRIVAEKMGWDDLAEDLAAENGAPVDREEQNASFNDFPEETWEEPEPDPATEGIDWIRDERGYIKHPLQQRCFELSIKLYNDCTDLGLFDVDEDHPDETFHEMKFNLQRASAKLAGALNSLARGESSPEPGFIIANLKRSLRFINDALGMIQQVGQEGKMPDHIQYYRQETHEIRTEIIQLMERFRHE